MYNPNALIELRAVKYARRSRVLEYRKIPTTKWGKIIQFILEIFDCSWKQPRIFGFYESELDQSSFWHDYNWSPIWVNTREHFKELKEKFKTIGDLRSYLQRNEEKGLRWWKQRRKEYLEAERYRTETLY